MRRNTILFLIISSVMVASHAQAQPSPPSQGLDIGTVIQSTSLFSYPSSDSLPISALPRGSITVLTSTTEQNGWYNVVQFSTGRQGWVLSSRLHLRWTNHHVYDLTTVLQIAADETQPPVIRVTNKTEKTLYFHLGTSPEVPISAGGTQDITAAQGVVYGNVSEAGVWPSFGSFALSNGDLFSVSYIIVKGTDQTKRRKPSSWQLSELSRLQALVDFEGPEIDTQRPGLQSQSAAVDQDYNTYKADADQVDASKSTVDTTNQSAIDSFNALVDRTNAELATYQTAHDAYSSATDAFNALVSKYNSDLAALQNVKNSIDNL